MARVAAEPAGRGARGLPRGGGGGGEVACAPSQQWGAAPRQWGAVRGATCAWMRRPTRSARTRWSAAAHGHWAEGAAAVDTNACARKRRAGRLLAASSPSCASSSSMHRSSAASIAALPRAALQLQRCAPSAAGSCAPHATSARSCCVRAAPQEAGGHGATTALAAWCTQLQQQWEASAAAALAEGRSATDLQAAPRCTAAASGCCSARPSGGGLQWCCQSLQMKWLSPLPTNVEVRSLPSERPAAPPPRCCM